MALTSSVYRLAPSDGYVSAEEQQRRLKVKMRRLVEQFGQEAVLRRIREWPMNKDQEPLRHWLLLTAWATESRRGGSI